MAVPDNVYAVQQTAEAGRHTDTQTLRSRDVTRCIAQNLPFQQILSTLDSPTGLTS